MKKYRYKYLLNIKTLIPIILLLFCFELIQANRILHDPDKAFKIKGFHIDLRSQVMTIDALKNTATELAAFGINTIIMEWEGTYPYENHATISNANAYSRDEIKSYIQYCNNLGIEVITLQQCFGHLEYILRHNRYAHLREDEKDISQLCPLKVDESIELFSELFRDMISLHNSDYIHIGGDETCLLGKCNNCRQKVEEEGISKLYIDYIKKISRVIIDMGKRPVIWADMVLQYPDALVELPQEVVLVDWNYGWNKNYFGNIENILEKNFTIWGAPAIRSHPDDWYLTCWEKHFNNQRDFIPFARNNGYDGVVMTSWSTSGLYGFTWDIGWEVIDMQQIRNVYPMSGFRILIASYSHSLNINEPLSPEEFVINYSSSRFGFNKIEGKILWNILITNPVEIVKGKPVDGSPLASVKDSLKYAKYLMLGLKPKKNNEEFEHLALMLDMRIYYVDLKILESKYNSSAFSRDQIQILLSEATNLKKTADRLNRRFYSLNKGYLKKSEIIEQNRVRNQRLNVLYNRLQNER